MLNNIALMKSNDSGVKLRKRQNDCAAKPKKKRSGSDSLNWKDSALKQRKKKDFVAKLKPRQNVFASLPRKRRDSGV